MQDLREPSSLEFSFTPPDFNHEISFNATQFAINNFGQEAFPLPEFTFVLTCSFINGEDVSDLVSPVDITITLQKGETTCSYRCACTHKEGIQRVTII